MNNPVRSAILAYWAGVAFVLISGMVATAWSIGKDPSSFDGVQWSDPGPWILVILWAIVLGVKTNTGKSANERQTVEETE